MFESSRRAPPARAVPWVIVALLAALAAGAHAGNGDSIDGYPNYQERVLLALTNACRQGPAQYRDAFLPDHTGIFQIYLAVRALTYSHPLQLAARAHCMDMATNDCFAHTSCDGTSFRDRVASYYTESAVLGETIQGGANSAFQAFNLWAVDDDAPDMSGQDLHRQIIMLTSFHEMGNGYVYAPASSFRRYYTQNYGGGAQDFATPLVWGSHIFPASGTIEFLANYDSPTNEAPQEAVLILDDVEYTMTADFGTSARGTYRVTQSTATGCRAYRFRFRDAAGTTWYHPEGGVLYTTGEGGCTQEYEALATGVDDAPPARLAFALAGANPVAGTVRFDLALPARAQVELSIFDVAGRLVRRMACGEMEAGRHTLTWTPREGRSGVFFARAIADGRGLTRSFVVLE